MSPATYVLTAPREGRHTPRVTLHEWRSGVAVWAALPPYDCRRWKVVKHLLALHARLPAQEARTHG
jgi:hypothetical protein